MRLHADMMAWGDSMTTREVKAQLCVRINSWTFGNGDFWGKRGRGGRGGRRRVELSILGRSITPRRACRACRARRKRGYRPLHEHRTGLEGR